MTSFCAPRPARRKVPTKSNHRPLNIPITFGAIVFGFETAASSPPALPDRPKPRQRAFQQLHASPVRSGPAQPSASSLFRYQCALQIRRRPSIPSTTATRDPATSFTSLTTTYGPGDFENAHPTSRTQQRQSVATCDGFLPTSATREHCNSTILKTRAKARKTTRKALIPKLKGLLDC